MSLLFLDIETYVSKDEPDSGLNPYFRDSKVIVITYNYYEQFTINFSNIKRPIILKEWEYERDGEKIILNSFYNFLKSKIEKDRYFDKNGKDRCGLTIVGFNHLKFDLPYLFGRLLNHSIDYKKDIFRVLFKEPSNTDLMQLNQLIHRESFEKNKLISISQKNVCKYFGLPVKEGNGNDLSRFYDQKRYDEILKYIYEEFTFEQLYLVFIDKVKKSLF